MTVILSMRLMQLGQLHSHCCAMYKLHSGNLKKAWQQLQDWGGNSEGRQQIREALQLCPAADLANNNDVDELAQWAQNAFDYLVGTASSAQLSRCRVPLHLVHSCHSTAVTITLRVFYKVLTHHLWTYNLVYAL